MGNGLKTIRESRTAHHLRRHWLTVAFVGGFITDFLLLNQVDNLLDNLVLLFYVTLAMVSILLLYASTAGKLPEDSNPLLRTYAPVAMQYAFGGLLSGMLIFYGRSASLLDSWPFLLIIATIIYLNETVRDRSGRLVLTLSMFFVGLFSYVVLVVPVLLGQMGAWVFIASGLLALAVMYLFLGLLRLIIPNFLAMQMRVIVFSVGTIFVGFNFLYFLNIIPPIPLSIQEVGIYHSVVRFENGDYQLKYEEGEWWRFWKQSDTVFHPESGGNIYCFASIFAPTRLATEIYNRWEFYDESKKEWVTSARINYPIHGGRSDGYRGYTQIGNFKPGEWRCSVETARGQILGRERFSVDTGSPPAGLVTRVD
ncbi:hypothetical protein A2837_03405 [Candidatus Kaiserbacteria bacterium RIFCSPHIGHO2_01_FULL_46_22]|uniref:DUF2914 domain-containing protein n=1 Tax=Candidatus Kaiserbacteria bacterium RIFCSPHIGHO2_01_FULL_46_22 TaxID=1798475 RepID=A0A1F6BX95_9BACT|nr:MAG: hypothetical protein A2837_03405 [Candidatus Kaiserbacteria bacterium RIFCSPHIGHO2_01_FULL_46_22]